MSDALARGILYHEPPIFELGTPGRTGASLPPLDVPPVSAQALWPNSLLRQADPQLPEVSEPQVVRHYTRASQWNFSIDTGMYPLGSCTMKHNPKIADALTHLSSFAEVHPYQPVEQLQGSLALLFELEQMLAEIGGFVRVALSPAAGAHGELTGLMMIRAYHHKHGRHPSKVLIPDTAHGTNPASCTLNGFVTVQIATSEDGRLSLDSVKAALDEHADDVAGTMITNPNTLGLFESAVADIARLVHAAGGLVYMDGANLNAIVGQFRPGDVGIDCMHYNLHKTFGTPHGGGGPGAGPVGVAERLVPFLPLPTIERAGDRFFFDHDRPDSIGRVRAGIGNFAVLLRAYAFLRELGAPGLRRMSEMAVLNANYIRAAIREFLHVPHPDLCMHEVVASDRGLKDFGVTTLDLAKRLIDYGFHPPTVYFPLVVPGALMIEPTESESLNELNAFIAALRAVVAEAKQNPALLKNAPHTTGVSRIDEAQAARRPILRWNPPTDTPTGAS